MKFFSLICLATLFFLALLSFWIDYDPYFINLPESFSPPSWSHPFGLDENGKGLFLQVIYGVRTSFIIVFSVIALSFVMGLILGTLAGYWESWLEMIIMSLVDMVLAFPKFLMALALVALLGGSLYNMIFALTFSTWAGFARLVRAELKPLKKKEFVLQSKSSGAGAVFLIYKHIWPNLFGICFVHALFQMVAVLIAESGLSFLGLGLSIEKPSLGALLGMGRNHLFSSPHIIFFPSLILFLLLLSLNDLGERFKKRIDPLV